MRENVTWILDAGHGGMSLGEYYLTKGKQSLKVPPGIYEGEFNQAIVERIERLCDANGMPYVSTRPGAINISLKDRCAYARDLNKKVGNGFFLSIHANAQKLWDKVWGKAKGSTVFYHPARPSSREFAENAIAALKAVEEIPTTRGIKPSRTLRVLRATKMDAALIECLFMTNKGEAIMGASEMTRDQIAQNIHQAMMVYSRRRWNL